MPVGQTEIIDGTKKLMAGKSRYDYWLRQYYGVDPTDGSALYLPISTTGTPANTMRYIANKSGGVDTVTTNVNNARLSIVVQPYLISMEASIPALLTKALPLVHCSAIRLVAKRMISSMLLL